MDVRCVGCGKVYSLEVTTEQLADWRAGTLIQTAMPHLTADERELLISKTCGPCFDSLFAHEDEEYEAEELRVLSLEELHEAAIYSDTDGRI
jgi:hypothetical protein